MGRVGLDLLALVLRHSHADAIRLDRDNAAGGQNRLVLLNDNVGYGPLSYRSDIDKSHDARMRNATHNRELTEILVECNEYAAISVRPREDRCIAGVFCPVARMNDVVSGSRELRSGFSPYTCVEQQLHTEASATRGSILSWATKRCAYARHARMSSNSSHG